MIRQKLLGSHVDIIEEEDAFDRIMKLSETDTPVQVILLDTRLLMKAKFNKELFAIINASQLVIPVSPGIRVGLHFLKKEKCPIVNSHKFTIRLLSYLEEHRKIVYLVGGGKKMIQKAEKNIKDSYPGIHLMGTHHIKYKKDFEIKLLTNIQKISPSLLVVSMSRPKQEKWIHKNKKYFKKGVILGVEGFVDYVAEKDLPPFDQLIHSIKRSVKNFFKGPFVTFTNFMFILYLITYKIFKIEKE